MERMANHVSAVHPLLLSLHTPHDHQNRFSGDPNSKTKQGPMFELVGRNALGNDVVLYASPKAKAAPYCYDDSNGGHAKNYSNVVAVDQKCSCSVRSPTELYIVFHNHDRNLHLQASANTQYSIITPALEEPVHCGEHVCTHAHTHTDAYAQ